MKVLGVRQHIGQARMKLKYRKCYVLTDDGVYVWPDSWFLNYYTIHAHHALLSTGFWLHIDNLLSQCLVT